MSRTPYGSTPSVRAGLVGLMVVMAVAAARAQEPAAPIPPPWTIVHHLVGDAGQLGTPTNLLILGLGGALAAVVHPHDAATVRVLSANHHAEELLDAGATTGNGLVQLGSAAALYGVGSLLHKPTPAHVGAELLEAQLLNGAVTQGVKAAVGRTRPDGGPNSFPSGHASASFTTAQVIAERFGWRYGLLGYFGATYVSASRIADRHHFTSDVVFGAAIGIACAHAVETSAHHRVTVTPAAVPKGVGVYGSVRVN